MRKAAYTALAFLAAGTMSIFGQTAGLGLKFAATDPNADESSLFPEEVAGIVPQANWNNLSGATGTGVGSLVLDNAGTAEASSATVTWSAPNTWRSGANNAFLNGSDHKLMNGYLDTGNTAANGVNISVNNLDAAFTTNGYDVYVYFVSDSNANRGGGYTLDDGNGAVLKYGSTMGTPTEFVEDPGTDQNLSADGNYLRFKQLTGSSFTLKSDTTLTSPNGTRAPINAIQIVPTPQFGPDFVTQPTSVSVYSGRTVRFSAAVDAYPRITSVRWQKDGTDLMDNARVSGASTTNLIINNVTAMDAGNYTLVATSPLRNTTSDGARLAIVAAENSAYVTAVVTAGPVANWRLNESDSNTNAFDFEGGWTGFYRDGAMWGASVEGLRPADFPGFDQSNTAVMLSGSATPGSVQVPTPALNTNSVTLLAWINPATEQLDYTGLLMTRAGTQAGLGYTTNNQIGYTWNNNSTWTWSSGLVPPDNQWSLVAVVIETNRATMYLATGGTISAAINPIPHTVEAWGGVARIGDDTGGANRQFNGRVDEVAVFNRALSFQEVAGLYAAASGMAQNSKPIISPQPISTLTRYAGATASLTAAATGSGTVTLQWKKGAANVANDARISGATSETLTIRNLTSADAGDYTLVATNPNGSTTSTVATLTVLAVPNAFVSDLVTAAPLSYWRLNETGDPSAGTEPVRDYVGGRDGTYGVAAQNLYYGVEGPRPAQGFGALETDNGALLPTVNFANSWATVPGLGISTNTLTIMAWINPNTRVADAGIVFARAGQAATGLGLAGNGNLGYTWLDQAATYNFASSLTPPLNQWSLVAVAVEPTRAVLYMINADGVRSATNTFNHGVRAFTDNIRIGGDPNNNNRTFDGRIDEVAIFDRTLTGEDLNRFFQRALGSVAPTISANPAAAEQFEGDTVSFTVSAVGTAPLTYRWEKRVRDVFQPVVNGGNISGTDTATLTITDASQADAIEYRAIVSNALGTATSEPAPLFLLTAPTAPGEGTFGGATVSSGAFAYWRLNELDDPSTSLLKAYDYAGGGHHATYGVASANGAYGITGPRPSEGFSVFEESNTALAPAAGVADSWVTVPPLGFTTNVMTIVAWINPASIVNDAGIVFWRAGQPATGLGLGGAGNLAYHWLDTQATYSWDSGLTPPIGQWSLAALVVEPDHATAYLINADGTQSAVNTTTHAVRTFSDAARIGNDPNAVTRTFNGSIDEVAVFTRALSAEELQGLYNGQAAAAQAELSISQTAGQATVSWTAPGTLQSTTELNGDDTVWFDESTTGKSFTTPASGTAKFYRLKQ